MNVRREKINLDQNLSPVEIKNKIRIQYLINLITENPRITYSQIAEELGICRTQLYAIMKKEDLTPQIIKNIKKISKEKLKSKTPRKPHKPKNKTRKSDNTKSFYEKIFIRSTLTQKRHPVEVTLEYVLQLAKQQKDKCALTGVRFNKEQTNDKHENALLPSLDRIDPNKGYIEGNIQWVTRWANLAKNAYSQDFFYKMCLQIKQHYKTPPKVRKSNFSNVNPTSILCYTDPIG